MLDVPAASKILKVRHVKPGKNALPIVFAVRMAGVMAEEIFLHACCAGLRLHA